MPRRDRSHQFFLTFESVAEFDRTFKRSGPEAGVFFPSQRTLSVGERVSIQVTIQGIQTPISLEGRIVWRRVRSGGPDMPSGVFVGLLDRDRAHLDAIIHYLHSLRHRPDRRRYQRYPMYLPASYYTAKGEFSSETRDLSKGGAFLRCRGPLLNVGAQFPLVLYLDGEGRKGTSLMTQVVWIDYFEETRGMGVVFLEGQTQLRKIGRMLDRVRAEVEGAATQTNPQGDAFPKSSVSEVAHAPCHHPQALVS